MPVRLRLTIAALALAVTAPVVNAMPAAAAPAPVDPAQLAAVKSAFTAGGQAWTQRGGITRSHSVGAGSDGSHTLIERDASGVSHVVVGGPDGRTEFYMDRKTRTLAARLTAPVRRALTKHGWRPAPKWFRFPGRQSSSALVTPKTFAEAVDRLDTDVVGLTATASGDRTTYVMTVTDSVKDPDGTTEEYTAVTDHGLLVSLSGPFVEYTFSYGHPPIAPPHAERRHLRFVLAEHMLWLRGQLLKASAPTGGSRAKRVAALRRLFRSTELSIPGSTTSSRPVRRGMEVTETLKSWKHPLTWRYLVAKKTVVARPVRTA